MPGSSPASVKTAPDDPFEQFLKPPPGETPADRELRLAQEEEALRISMAIDASIKAERQARKKVRIVRLLLLGQSESETDWAVKGKSTTLRQFQRLYTPTAFREERILWRAVIQLNIVRSVRIILDALNRPSSPPLSPSTSPKSHTRSLPNHRKRQQTSQFGTSSETSQTEEYFSGVHSGNEVSDHESDSESHNSFRLDPPALEALKMRLIPLRHIEALLIAKLVPPDEDEATHLAGPSPPEQTYPPSNSKSSYRTQEIFVRPNRAWKGGLARARVHYSSSSGVRSSEESASVNSGRPISAGTLGLETSDEPQEVLNACRSDIMLLWADRGVKELLHRRKIRLEESPGFFLNDLERVTSLKYIPTDDDVLKARLKTVGVSEYRFRMEVSTGKETGTLWDIIDVGGSRSQRQTWVPFFDDVDAIIFLAPISGFDQVLAEDRTVNRLEDSVLLWKSVCSNKLLANVDLVLFLNKCDILDVKLKAGVRLAKYVRSYGDRANDLETTSKYLRSKFSAIHREYSPIPRKFYAFCTSVTDTATTAGIIASGTSLFPHPGSLPACQDYLLICYASRFFHGPILVRDMVIRQHLRQSKLM
ncbi:hypothetical protein GYMLUDRAFT_62818 [Collybiopsis luxurians FD-317 M1]|uniref:G-alpha-domain-containing protein n=1 Tax=Collybiopsis luxurians FD-317 M1 TaxID=944289 RepID=A0A0D0CJ86_9AGAR|nr:hypothetical protein GYMLUDRAFT_62818 [Collybiopsis luxurians FD-317 M1]